MPSPQKPGLASTSFFSTKNISNLSDEVFSKFESRVTAPRNPKLIRTTELPKERTTPSMYMQMMSLDTDQKLAKTHDMRLPRVVKLLDMSETTHQKISYVDIDEAMFQPFPSEIYFQSFEPFHSYEVPLLLRNNDRVPRLVKVTQKDSPYFKIISPDDVSHKVAPGMASVFKIQFTPEDKKDYQHELICMTEREQFIVPVNCIGARAILDFPDEVNFGICPVKHPMSKVLFVRNIGNRESKCSMNVQKPFSVSMKNGSLPVGGSMQVTLEFQAEKVGDHRKDLVIKYDTGEAIHVALYGAAVDANVRLDKSTVRIDNTYVFMANQRTITIHNRSDVLTHFKWSSYATRSEEDSQKERFCAEVKDEESQERERFINECIEDPTLRDRLSILTRTFKNRQNVIGDDPLFFSDDVFKIFPLEGDIWPNSTTEVTVVFKPTEVKTYQRSIFCDITGRESRLPLKVRGDGIGPRLAFSFDAMDIGNIFTSSTHSYEAVLINKGDIDAIFSLVPNNSSGSRFYEFRFDPVEGIVLPGGHQAVEISFRSEALGRLSQDFVFSIDGSPEELKLCITGNVIGPTFHFDVPRLRFGDVSYGFNHTKMCSLVNTSLVPMTFVLRIPDDGKGEPSISSMSDLGEGLLGEMGALQSISAPREFDITPAQGTIRPQSEMKIHVTLCSNTLKKYDCRMMVDVKGVGKELLSLPILAKTVVPSIQVMTPVLDFKRCFLNFAYQLRAQLVNDTDLCAKYELLPQVRDELSAIVFGSPKPKGLIEPRSMVEVPIVVQAHELGEQESTAFFSIFGCPDQPLPCQLSCTGEGPVVHITPTSMNWGQTEVLSPSSKTVKLSNESLVPADFIAQMMRPDTVWHLDPQQGTIPPQCVMHITVTAILNDSIKFQDKLTVSIVKGPIVTIPVQGHGFGTTIVLDPPIAPSTSLGPHFAKTKCVRKYKITNKGRRHQSLAWTTDGFARPRTKRDTSVANSKDMKYRLMPVAPPPPEPVFKLYPTRVALEPGHSSWLTLEGYSETPRQVCETLVCHSIIGKANGKEKIIKAAVRADFISPVLEVAKKKIEFRVDKRPDDVTALTPQTRTFSIRNVTSLPLTCILRVDQPFQLLGFYGSPQSLLEVNLSMGQELEITIRFDPAFKEDLVSRVAEGEVSITYQEHPHTDSVSLRGEVNFPNLNFDKTEIDFGCILNDTEVAKFLDITNTSPLPVSYRWSFLVVEGEENIRYLGQVEDPAPSHVQHSETHVTLEPAPEARSGDPDVTMNEEASAIAVGASSSSQEQQDRLPSSEGIKKETETSESEQRVDESVDRYQSDSEMENVGISLDWHKEEAMRVDAVAAERALEEERFRASSRLSSRHQPSHPIHTRLNELPLLPWLGPGANHVPNGVEEVFDILPLYGTLEAGETQRVTFTYYGHADVICNARAVCEVQGGPKYEVKLVGEASLIEYKFNKSVVNFGKQMFDQVAVSQLKLENTGRVGFNFAGISGLGEDEVVPGMPTLHPSSGHVDPFSEVTLNVNYLPGVPERFHKSFEIQIAHFEPTIINVLGEGIFPRLCLDLPRFAEEDESYSTLLKEAKENLERETVKHEQSGGSVSTPEKRKDDEDMVFSITENLPSDHDIQMEVERLILKDFASENQHFFSAGPFPNPSGEVASKKKKFPRVRLTDYVLDFGYVVLGNVRSHIIRATNTSHFPVSFSADRSSLYRTGFSVELDRVKQLPGYPDHETVDFKVTFDPRGANLGVGPVEAMVPINIVSGPQLCIRMRAHVAVPDLSVSTDSVDFDVVQCGQCKVMTIQLHNDQQVRCEWTSVNPESSRSLVDKHVPMHLRRKMRRENKPKPTHFEMMPAQGFLAPGQRMNIQIKFMPTETKYYTQRLCVHISQGTSRVSIACRGEGQESRLEFEPNLVEFGPILPHGVGDEVDVIVRNPTAFAVEFYSLNFDKQYLVEEKILRMMKGYDEMGNLLLPPRLAGEDLPPELLQHYQEQEERMQEAKQKQDAADQAKTEASSTGEDLAEVDESEAPEESTAEPRGEESANVVDGHQNGSVSRDSSKKKPESEEPGKSVDETEPDGGAGVGDLEITPVSAAIARHLGIDLTPEGRSARNRRGIVIIVHGPPGSGKTNTSVLLAKTYGAARMTIDAIVLEAISNGNTQASASAKELVETRQLGDSLSKHIDFKLYVDRSTNMTKSGLKARELCAQTARGLREEEADPPTTIPGGLSVEAVTAHAGQSVVGVPESRIGGGTSVVSTKKTSILSKQPHSTMGSKAGGAGAATISENTGSNVPSSPPLVDGPVCRRLSVSASVAGEDGLVSCVLPGDLLIDILAERLQLNDCHQGVVFDGLDTLFSANYQSTLLSLLKAINNRKHIYFVSQKLDYNTVRSRRKAVEEESAKTLIEEEEKRKHKLEEMDEEEYDALDEEEKEEIERKILLERKERIKRETEERHERERVERERMALLEEKRLEEENLRKKGKKGKREETAKRSISGKQELAVPGQAGAGGKDKAGAKAAASNVLVGQASSHEGLDKGRPESRFTERAESDDGKKHKKKHRPVSDEEPKDKISEEVKEEYSDVDIFLQNKFRAFDKTFKDVSFLLQYWDRTQLLVTKSISQEGAITQGTIPEEEGINNLSRDKAPPSGKKASKKEREKERLERLEKERLERERAERERMEKEKADREKLEGSDNGDELSMGKRVEEEGVPHLQLDANDPENPCCHFILELNQLPSVDEVLDGLGLGPKGPPIPPPATFSVIPFPVKRKAPSGDPAAHYEFIASSPDDPNVLSEYPLMKDTESHPEDASPSDMARSDSKREEHGPSQGKDKKKRDQRSDTAKTATGRRSSPRRSRRGSNEGGKSPPPPVTPGSEADQSSILGDTINEFKTLKLNHFRWTVPAYSEILLRIQFVSDDLGQFDQTLSFELTGTRRRYQLFCRGVCAFPTISREPRIVFPHRRKMKVSSDDLIAKKYLLQEEVFEFGPLLCGKTRERYKEGKYPENMERINIMNTSPLTASISFCFQHDSNATTFLLDPPNMILDPNETKPLSLWAYPKTAGRFLDTIVCCVRENPEPICFNVSCYGVRPELELDRKQLHFDKVLLHRKDSRGLYLRNSTMLPVSWHVAGMENMGEDFSLNQESGIIEPHCEFSLQLNFRATKASNIKKAIRLEVSDVGNIMGLVQTENIQVTAEAYDVALDMSFPKGADGGLDFGSLRVQDETKQTCSLKNKGKYEIGFNFLFEREAPGTPPIDTLFSVLPQKGTLVPNDRPTQVQVIFRSQSEVSIRDYPLLKCQVIEPSIGDGKEVIASIPIRISVRSIFSKYSIFPKTDINFGPMVLNSKKSRTFTIENKGEFDFKYSIVKMIREAPNIRPRPMVLGGKRMKSRDGSSSSRSAARVGRTQSVRQDVSTNQTRLLVGCFTVYPGFGTILPGGAQNVTVDCVAESAEKTEEFLSIDVTDRDPDDHASGIPYRVVCEGCTPNINTHDIASIFEEHRICNNLNIYLRNKKTLEGNGVYGEEDNKFMFCNVLVGRRAYARFKISNTNKVAVDVSITVKPVSNKVSARIHDIFDLDVSKTQIPPHGFIYATVSFCPPAMHTYVCNFEAAVDGVSSTLSRNRGLSFEISGEGNLPRVTVTQPIVRNKKGEPLLVYQRLLVHRSETLLLSLKNDGNFPSKVNMTLEQPAVSEGDSDTNLADAKDAASVAENVFTLVPRPGTDSCAPITLPGTSSSVPYTASVILAPEETALFDVTFKPTSAHIYNAQIRVATVDNQFEEHKVQLYGEGFKDDITFDNLHVDGDMAALAGADGVVDTESLSQTQLSSESAHGPVGGGHAAETIMFGDCEVGAAKTRTFALTNHNPNDTLHFKFDEHPNVHFVPSIGHLHPGTSKEMTVTFKGEQPSEVKKALVKCSVAKINFSQPTDQISDWDDRMRTVKWTDVVDQARPTARPIKKKVVETEPEPEHTVVEESARQLDLVISAKVDYAKYSCDTSSISFKDTLMFQTRIYEFTIKNAGKVSLEYSWQLVVEGYAARSPDADGRPSTATHSARSAGVESSIRSILNDSSMPFSVAPPEGSIKSGQKQRFSVRFSPMEVTEFNARLICSIANLEHEQQGPSISLRGRSLMPYCHFELEDSDYITSSRRNPDHPGPGGAPPGATLDPNTRVIEFNSVGVDAKNSKKFWIMNPTSSDYSFRWICQDVADARVPSKFNCYVKEGQLLSGKKLEMSFSFTPSKLEVCESFWKFVILEQNISIPFLLVGHTNEPQVALSSSHINFKSLLVGRGTADTVELINNEPIGFSYEIVEQSCHSEAYSSKLEVSPSKGFLSANSRIPIQVGFTARSVGDASFNVIINISRKTKRLTLNVKASGHSLDVQLLCENSQGSKIELSPMGLNAINLGEVEIREKSIRQLHLVNSGKHNFNFNWTVSEEGNTSSRHSSKVTKKPAISLNPDSGVVAAGSRKRCLLMFQPKKLGPIPVQDVTLKVHDGPTYLCHVSATGVNPGLEFSTKSHDFGACFIYKAGMPLNTATVHLVNRDRKDISVECLYQNTSHLEVNFSANVLSPGRNAYAYLTFYPRDTVAYCENVTFLVNGLSKHDVIVKGQGTELRVEVSNPKQKTVKFGALRVGEAVKHLIPIINRSPAAITLTLSVTPVMQALHDPTVLKVLPSEPITLEGKGGTKAVEVYFTPKTRIPVFTEEVMMECAGMSQPLFIVTGSCQGIQINLDQDSIPFGAVVQGSRSDRRFIMQNNGDIGAGFKWDPQKFLPDFSISPVVGYISPGMEVPFTVTFHPRELSQDIRYEALKCAIEGGKSLKLTLTGMCIGTPPLKELVNFNCHVRGRDARTVVITNRSNQRWSLQPIIDGEYWTGPDLFVVEAQQSKQYEMVYRPLNMTTDGKKHQGSVFFPLPDGSGLLYNLQGQADPPKPISSVTRDVPCKTSYVELLSVTNWLRKPQRFRVTVEMIKPDKLDPGTTLKGLDYIDVPGSMKRDYKLNFFAHKEGTFGAKVVFKNERTGEYLFYYVTLRATSPGVMGTIELITPVRRSALHTLRIENPLSYPVTFVTECKVMDVNLPTQFTVPSNSEGTCMFEYQPLKVVDGTGKLTLTNNDLGVYTYDLILKATAAGPEKTAYFRTALGGNHVVTIKFQNYARQKTDYICKIDSPEWICERSITAAPASSGSGTEVTVDITYEPVNLGQSQASLSLTSVLGGEYTVPLQGSCEPPKPQGPFTVRNKSTVSIPFRNVFPSTTQYSLQVDNPVFSVKAVEAIRAKKSHNISVLFDGAAAPGSVVTGKLTLTCTRAAGGPTTWVFYLKGVTPDQTLL